LLRSQPAWGETIAGFRPFSDTKGFTTIPDGSGFGQYYKVADPAAEDWSTSTRPKGE